MSPHPVADVLSAASLMATIVAILYSLWYPEIRQVLNLPWHEFHGDRVLDARAAKASLLTRAFPLFLASVLPAVVFAPDAIGEAAALAGAARQPGWTYDSVQAAFLGVYALVIALVLVAAGQVAALTLWFRKLNKADAPTS